MNLRAEGLTFGYRANRPVLRDVTIEAAPGRLTALWGPNGSGKSTLLRCLNGALRPQGGRVLLDGRSLDRMTPRQIACHVAVVPQDTPADVPLTVSEMVLLGRYARGGPWGEQTNEDRAIVRDCLARLGVLDMADRRFAELSGGERQRVIIARALAQQGRVLLLDEPASHLDIAHQVELYQLVRRLAAEGQAVVMVCHDLLLAPMYVDVAVLMAAGRIEAMGIPAQVFTHQNLLSTFSIDARMAWTSEGAVRAEFPTVRR
jgi:iron complex transport system ATP-binding protein